MAIARSQMRWRRSAVRTGQGWVTCWKINENISFGFLKKFNDQAPRLTVKESDIDRIYIYFFNTWFLSVSSGTLSVYIGNKYFYSLGLFYMIHPYNQGIPTWWLGRWGNICSSQGAYQDFSSENLNFLPNTLVLHCNSPSALDMISRECCCLTTGTLNTFDSYRP